MRSQQSRVNGSDCPVLPPLHAIKPMRDTQPQKGPGPSETFYGCDTRPQFSSFGCGCLTLTIPSYPEHQQVGRSCHRQCIPWAFPGKWGGQATVSHFQNGKNEPGRIKGLWGYGDQKICLLQDHITSKWQSLYSNLDGVAQSPGLLHPTQLHL